MQRFQLFTLDFKKYDPSMGVPVRSSNGYPRYVKYKMQHAAKETFPTWPMVKGNLTQEEFGRQYFDLLDSRGLDVIASRFRAIATAEGEPRLVLMCYEDLAKGQWCHRTYFAQWWEKMTGEVVAELGPTCPPADPYPQPEIDFG